MLEGWFVCYCACVSVCTCGMLCEFVSDCESECKTHTHPLHAHSDGCLQSRNVTSSYLVFPPQFFFARYLSPNENKNVWLKISLSNKIRLSSEGKGSPRPRPNHFKAISYVESPRYKGIVASYGKNLHNNTLSRRWITSYFVIHYDQILNTTVHLAKANANV